MPDEKQETTEAPKPETEPKPDEFRALHDRYLRLAAEFDNWKKRAARETTDAVERAEEAIFLRLLPILDSVERASKQMKTDDPIAKGIQMVYRQLFAVAEKLGIERFDPVGDPFDPRFHHALQEIDTVEIKPGIVAEVLEPGYRRGTKLLRPAMVTVARSPRLTDEPRGEELAKTNSDPDQRP